MAGIPWRTRRRWTCPVLRGTTQRSSTCPVLLFSVHVLMSAKSNASHESHRVRQSMYNALVLVIAACLLPSIHGSAIPMWEYLSRGEKMSHLFNLFVQQVEKHCASRPEPDCSKLLLVYGLTNLAKMEDESLDDMDPYQRGANEIVWDSMMKGSSKHNHVDGYSKQPSSTPIPAISGSTPNYIDSPKGGDDLEVSEPGSLEAASSINVEETEPQSFLLGPMVVRVLPNGMPIPGEKNQLPKDEDIEELAPTRFRSFPVSQQSSNNKLGYGDSGPSYQGPRPSYPSRHSPGYYQSPYETYRARSPTYPVH